MNNVVIDSRGVQPGDIFVAIRGERLDGHDFIADAISRGATTIVSARAPQSDAERQVDFVQVPDTIIALADMARAARATHPIPLVGITGSCGKTSVKGMLGSILLQRAPTLVTQGNLNNHLGLPLTLLKLKPEHAYAVIEMGASQPGDIQYLCDIAKPNVTLITQVAPAHLKGFGSIENVAKAKAEIYDALPDDGIAILNSDDPFYAQWLRGIGDKHHITFGTDAMVHATNIQLSPFSVQFDLNLPNNASQTVTVGIPGEHTVMNALAASAAAYALGLRIEEIVAGLEAFSGTPRRMASTKGYNGAWIIDDTYNANPVSMRAALNVLANFSGDKTFVMGDMAELGPDSDQFHAEIGALARSKGIQRLMGVGPFTALAAQAFGEGALCFADKPTLLQALKSVLHEEAVVLVKGSRSSGMDEISDALIMHKGESC